MFPCCGTNSAVTGTEGWGPVAVFAVCALPRWVAHNCPVLCSSWVNVTARCVSWWRLYWEACYSVWPSSCSLAVVPARLLQVPRVEDLSQYLTCVYCHDPSLTAAPCCALSWVNVTARCVSWWQMKLQRSFIPHIDENKASPHMFYDIFVLFS
jgi:hypothetical protein